MKKNIERKEPDWQLQEGLVTWKKQIYANKRRNLRTNDRNPSLLGTSWNRQNTRVDDTKLLVARDEEGHPKVHSKL